MRARSRRLVRAQHVRRGPAAIQVSPRTLRAALALRLQGPLRAVDAAELGTRRTHRALQEGRREVFHCARQSSRRLRCLGLQASTVERRRDWPASRCGRHMGGRRAQAGAAPRGHGASGTQLVVVPAVARRGQIRSAGRRSLRRRTHSLRGQRPVVAGARPAAPLRREAPARRTTRHLLRQGLLRSNARPDRSAQSRPALLRQFAAAAGLGRHEHRSVLLQPLPQDHRGQDGSGFERKRRSRSSGQSAGRRLRARDNQRDHEVSLAIGDVHRRVALQSRCLR